MQHFSQEYLDKLVAEHKLVSASLAHLKGAVYVKQTRIHGVIPVDTALTNLSAKKVELESYIDVLQEYLNG